MRARVHTHSDGNVRCANGRREVLAAALAQLHAAHRQEHSPAHGLALGRGIRCGGEEDVIIIRIMVDNNITTTVKTASWRTRVSRVPSGMRKCRITPHSGWFLTVVVIFIQGVSTAKFN